MLTRLKSLYELQLIDLKLDQLEETRGDLPRQVNELSSKITFLENQIASKQKEQKDSQHKINSNNLEMESLIDKQKKYKAQLYNVRNNKEYDALTKEIDYIDEQLSKFMAENEALEENIEKLKKEIDDIKPQLEEAKQELKERQNELNDIVARTQKEESKLREIRTQVEKQIKEPDLKNYMRIRKAKGGLAIATIERNACSGCGTIIPPQRQLEIKQNKRMFACEACGRILISKEIADSFNGKF